MKKSVEKGDSLLAKTRAQLRRFGLRARKGLGQHFLIDEGVLKLVVAAARLDPADVVIEIGPGLGVLTEELARQAGRVIAVELDDRMAAGLRQTLAPFDNVVVVNQDILKTVPETLLENETGSSGQGYKVVANLPYYITSPVLRHFLEAEIRPESLVVMVQKEVAEEITARPGRMSLLSVSVQLYSQPEIVDYVPARCFYPEPEVDSAILRVVLYPEPRVGVDRESFFPLVRAGFSAARKQLANSLARGLALPKAETLSLLERADIAPQRRAETLDIEEWAKLWRVYHRIGESS